MHYKGLKIYNMEKTYKTIILIVMPYFIRYSIFYLLGQPPSLQAEVSEASPRFWAIQVEPPLAGEGFVHDLSRVFSPTPHVLLHWLHWDQSL